jgi:hypothetical protein
MAVDFDRFRRWVERRFDDVIVKGTEIRINSIFEPDDDGHHLWLSPVGGKKRRKYGVFHCFKTDRKGSLINFVQLIDHCDREDALAILKGEPTVRDLEVALEEFFAKQQPEEVEPPPPDLLLPYGTYLIDELKNKWWKQKAEEYLEGRKIPTTGLYICTEHPYKSRIIIPYYDRTGKLIYWNGRHIFPQAKIRYLGPPKEVGVGKGDVIYMPGGKWPRAGELVHLCEGEFNAMSLAFSDLNAAACGGKNMNDKQAIMLADYRLVLCLDRDKAGKVGTTVMSDALSLVQTTSKHKDKLFVVRPPKPYKDWNEMYVKEGPVIVHGFIKKFAKPISYQFPYQAGADWTNFFGY